MFTIIVFTHNSTDLVLRFLAPSTTELVNTLTYITETFDINRIDIKVISHRK